MNSHTQLSNFAVYYNQWHLALPRTQTSRMMKPSSPIHAKWDLMSHSSASSSHYSSLLLLLSSFYNSYINSYNHHHNKHRLVRNVVMCLLIGWVLFQLLSSSTTTEVATNVIASSNTYSTNTKRYLQRRRNARIRNSLSYPPSTKPLYHPHMYEKSDHEVDVVVHNGLHRIGHGKRYFLFPSWRIATGSSSTTATSSSLSSSSATTTATSSGNSGINGGSGSRSSTTTITNGRLRRNSNWQLNSDRSYGSTTSSLRLDFH